MFIFIPLFAYPDQNQCLKGNPNIDVFTKTIQHSQSPLIKQYRTEMAQNTQGRVVCLNGSCNSSVDLRNSFINLDSIKVTRQEKISFQCAKSSLQRQVFQNSYSCEEKVSPMGQSYWERRNFKSGTNKAPCVDNNVLGYVQFVSNLTLECINSLRMSNGETADLDTGLTFSKINNESAFNFYTSYEGGVGLGQLTKYSVQEMNILALTDKNGKYLRDKKGNLIRKKDKFGNDVKGAGRKYLDQIINSNLSACKSLSSVIQHDLEDGYMEPRNPSCEWLSLETGIARNLIYSMGYFAYLKTSVIYPELKIRAPGLQNNNEILNYLTLVSYGPNGMSRAKALIRTLNMNRNKSNPRRITSMLKTNKYIAATLNKAKEVEAINQRAGVTESCVD